MAIPDYQSLMLPLLRKCGDRQEHTSRELIDALAEEFQLTPDEQQELLPSGRQPIIDNRVGWAKTYMKKAGLLRSPKRGLVQVTDRGMEVLSQQPQRINVAYLENFPEFVEFRNTRHKKETCDEKQFIETESVTPEEALELAYQNMRASLATEIREQAAGCSSGFFERLVVQLLVAMGYGGSRKDAGERLGRSGDGGIDGIIKEDRLGLDVIYLQAKRWNSSVGRPEVQKFVGALQGQRARKGVFITTSEYSREAREYAENLDCKVILIDGEQLAQYMIDFDIGVTKSSVYEVKRVDTDYYLDE